MPDFKILHLILISPKKKQKSFRNNNENNMYLKHEGEIPHRDGNITY